MLNHTAQVETAEIADAALDAVSGGLAAGGAGALSIETPLAHLGADLAAVASPEGITAGTSAHTTAL